jgi:DNA-binding NarL/FixJ family response regulator
MVSTPFNGFSPGKKNVLIVEDQPLLCERLTELINNEPDLQVCGTADNIADALELVRHTDIQLLLVDITLKGPSGLELIKEVTAQKLDLPILVLSMHDESLYAERVLRAGARGYISKQESSEQIMSAVRQVIRGQTYLSTQMTSKILRTFSSGPSHLAGIAGLTDRELEVFQLIGRGQTTREIGAKLQLGPSTVETYRARIKTKLNLENATQLSHEAVRWVEATQAPAA